jgi:hypothetical protein
VDSERKKENIQGYFQANIPGLLDLKRWKDCFSNDIMIAAHTILKFSLLDRLVDALELPASDGILQVERGQLPKVSLYMEDRVSILLAQHHLLTTTLYSS